VEYLVLVEHPPVVTLGRRADRSNVRVSEDELRRRGFELHETARGGDVTYHGPGQIVGYPIIDLDRHRTGVREYLRLLEEVLIRTLAEFDIDGRRIDGLTGVWTDRGKVAAIGVAVRRWITYHGFALNVNTDLSHFRVITPCGISGRPVTSLAEILGREIDASAVRRVLEREFRAVFGFDAAHDPAAAPAKRRLPPWLSKRLPAGGGADAVRSMLADLDLHTVCQSARCPNIHECFTRRTATFMILGSRCTRRCRFCAVTQGDPEPVDADEPARVAEAARRLGLAHVVVTSVTRDDLPDGGAAQFARTIRAVRESTGATVEVLTPDFRGDETSVRTVLDARPEVYNHNVETVPALYETVRPGADYDRSLALLARVRELDAGVFTKSGLMLGLGESTDEVLATLADLRAAGCDLLTLGQYLAPSKTHLAVTRFVPPEEFADLADKARAMGFAAVASGPFVRSSHDAAALYAEAQQNRVELT
ncbi:MAG TPA: lipoyl synthase, partial [Planctomycetota bacterium]|nr:lipoyl synthase [Planctomycetota bacterium]